MSASSLIGRLGSSAFRLSTGPVSMSLAGSCFSSESAPRLIPSWDSKARWNNLCHDLTVRVTAGSKRTCELTSSSREEHHATAQWNSSVLLFGLDAARFSCCCCGPFSGPAELGAVNPYAVHDHSQPACQGHDRLFHPAAPGDLHRPGFEMAPLRHLGAKVLVGEKPPANREPSMNEITTIGLDLAKHISRCRGLMQRERRFCASSFGGRSCLRSSVDFVWWGGGVRDGALLGARATCAGP